MPQRGIFSHFWAWWKRWSVEWVNVVGMRSHVYRVLPIGEWSLGITLLPRMKSCTSISNFKSKMNELY